MSPAIRLVLAIHNHQPVGNFDGVFEAAYQDSYARFLDVLEGAAEISLALHTSGSLMEWIVEHHPEYFDRLRALQQQGRLEILGGGYYEPILTMLPPRDRVGQIRAYSEFLEQTFDCRVRGAWVAERVWEQCLVSDLAQAGIEYTVLDDSHFRYAGLSQEQLCGYFLSEDCGHVLKIFPGSERLRYTIPFADPDETIAYLAGIAQQHPGAVVVFADDGEKFGTWPGTRKHVYENGWLARFFDALRNQRDWLQLCTLADAVDQTPPQGKVYIPAASYREMTEWAMPTQRQLQYEDMIRELPADPQGARIKEFIRGGYWRNFKAKYTEADEMYTRMLQVSNRVHEMECPERPGAAGNGNGAPLDKRNRELVAQAKRELYRGQCNCAYWHGAFGGLYLPHLRQAVYRHLIAADTALQKASGRVGPWVEARSGDFNLDLRQEVCLANDKLVAFFAPARGGMLYELDLRAIHHNLLATLQRRHEAYHQKLLDHAGHSNEQGAGQEAESIHDRVVSKQPDLDQRLQYDTYPRKSILDHFWHVDTTAGAVIAGTAEALGDFVRGVFSSRIRRSAKRVQVRMARTGKVANHDVQITKGVTLEADSPALQISYQIDGLPEDLPLRFGVEFNFAGLPPGASDRFFYSDHQEQLGPLETELDLSNTGLLGLVDEWLGVDVALGFSRPTGIWTFPIQTVSNSEGGFELIHQSTAVIPHWQVQPDANGSWHVEITLALDTSAAEAQHESQTVATS